MPWNDALLDFFLSPGLGRHSVSARWPVISVFLSSAVNLWTQNFSLVPDQTRMRDGIKFTFISPSFIYLLSLHKDLQIGKVLFNINLFWNFLLTIKTVQTVTKSKCESSSRILNSSLKQPTELWETCHTGMYGLLILVIQVNVVI